MIPWPLTVLLTPQVLVGEPSGDYDGTARIVLTRNVGVYGQVTVSWQITPRTPQAFVMTQDEVDFEDQQQEAVLVIQVNGLLT